MDTKQEKINTIDDYIAQYPPEQQAILAALRTVIREEAPDATERMSWQMPTFYLNGNLVHFAMQKHHVGFYPGPSGIAAFREQFDAADYKWSKGAVQFPLNQPLPLELVRAIVRYRVAEQS